MLKPYPKMLSRIAFVNLVSELIDVYHSNLLKDKSHIVKKIFKTKFEKLKYQLDKIGKS